VHELSTIKRSAFMKILGAVSPLPFLLIIACLILGAWAILHFDYNVSENMKIIFFILYFLGIWKLVTKL
jgi:hypothetical protein